MNQRSSLTKIDILGVNFHQSARTVPFWNPHRLRFLFPGKSVWFLCQKKQEFWPNI